MCDILNKAAHGAALRALRVSTYYMHGTFIVNCSRSFSAFPIF